jgi:hypothetical protein
MGQILEDIRGFLEVARLLDDSEALARAKELLRAVLNEMEGR